MSEPLWMPIEDMEALRGVIKTAAREAIEEVIEERPDEIHEAISGAVQDALAVLYERVKR